MKRYFALALLLALSPALHATTPALRVEQVRVFDHTPPLHFVRWVDPHEHAFSGEVPGGWRVDGGLYRASPSDTRNEILAVSPDGGLRISLGDRDFSSYIVPNPMLNATGFPEGSRYPNGYGGFIPVQRYLPGLHFAERYALHHGGCNEVNIVDRRERPELSQALNRILATLPGVAMRMTTGEVHFTCTANGQALRGYVFAGTISSQVNNGVGMWFVQHLYGYLAPESRVVTAQAALGRLVATFQMDPAWAAAQSRTTVESARIQAEANAHIARSISDSYWSRADTLQQASRRDANARRGSTDVADPGSGESWNVWGGHSYYWRVPGSNTIIGSDSPDPPQQGLVPLHEYR